jgi:hypothetical protein
MSLIRSAALAALLVALGWLPTGLAQDANKEKKDEALGRLLEKLEGPKSPEAKPDDEKKAEGQKDDAKPAESKPADDKKPGDLDSKDKALDSLLEKIGEKVDEPKTTDTPKLPGLPEPPKREEADKGGLKNKDKDLDRHLEDIQGHKKKNKNQQQQQQQGPGEEGGKLADAMKKMREVEQRLKKPDTGEETRRKQVQIVQDLDSMLKQLRQSMGRGGGGRMRRVAQAGQNGNQPGQNGNQGTNAGGVGPMKPLKPPSTHPLVGSKDQWGHLPASMRDELNNVMSEAALPGRQDLIRRYYTSLNNKKSRPKEE